MNSNSHVLGAFFMVSALMNLLMVPIMLVIKKPIRQKIVIISIVSLMALVLGGAGLAIWFGLIPVG